MMKNYEILETQIVSFAKKFYFEVDLKLLKELVSEFHKIIINFEFIKSFDTKNVIPLSFPCDDFFIISLKDEIKKKIIFEEDETISKNLQNNFSFKNEANYLVIKD
ncbi:hypothetical protein JTY60_02765 [symbiont of Argiope bruennichi]|uniref:hypothetical protein n=1 Tax=symbiont of Argiope bruennichi TaxID=2810479 RepID=UPI003DA6917C